MAKSPKSSPEINPAKRYRITFSKSFEHEGQKFVPRAGQKIKVSGTVLAAIKDLVDNYEEA